jgi:hypothetical protein
MQLALLTLRDQCMPTLYKPQLTEAATPMLEVWARMSKGLYPQGRAILAKLDYYAARDLEVPGPERDGKLTKDEEDELSPIVRALMEAAIISEAMPERILLATLKRVAKKPSCFFSGELPAAVQWEIAADYRRGDEKPGTFGMDVWGDEQTRCSYPLETPRESAIKKAAEAAIRRIEEVRSQGCPHNPANRIIAERLGNIFRSSGRPIIRRREPSSKMFKGKVIYIERGEFKEFLELVLPPLQYYLRERNLSLVTIDAVVRLATKGARQRNSLSSVKPICDFGEGLSPQPGEDATEVVADGGEDDVGDIAGTAP